MKEQVKQYWEERAKDSCHSPTATTNDVHLRELEILTIIQTLGRIGASLPASMLDVGCGDGFATLRIAHEFPNLRVSGVDYSENMIRNAVVKLESEPDLTERVTFMVGDVTGLDLVCDGEEYDFILSDRCLINLESVTQQEQAVSEIARHVRRGAYYIAIENFVEGQESMNQARREMGLKEIPIRWHNLLFTEQRFVDYAVPYFEDITFYDFSSSYYFATRVIYSAMCQMRGEEPDYQHEIHKLAVRLPHTGKFSPIKMVLLRRK